MPLRNQLNDLAVTFADAILDVIRSSSLEELLAQSGGRRGPGRPRANAARPARLSRRSAEDIEAQVTKVVALVKKSKGGLRAEQIRHELGLQPRELPRILKQGLAGKLLKSKGQKRATTYSAA